ncbi:hypothetical protein SAMN04488045_0276 [Thalassococcus halodurans]|uniref:HTH cro/C1-type domain-containing protein n=1 Tax=Thalassococcus halodurans TaxID=373675 RepID=A0A1H5SKQ6_9RHOB|nr:XRE family transcriptional regulator [Thalassococcus halodurans]SEF51179.1 hypothetical protein SAMN04488045_0276 [Thalassococcus halodurans]
MARDTLTGSRIRERRVMAGLKQAELASAAGISASYLNLIEHNRRGIGGKLLLDIAEVLGVEPALLSEGAEATLIAALREAASDPKAAPVEVDRVDEFAGRFPGWAGLLSDNRRRIASLERTVETLSDRLTHDPHLAASLHEMLSTVTSIRSTASILNDPADLSPEWSARFHRNVYEDATRLAETSRALVGYLEASGDATSEASAPQDEMDAVLASAGYFLEPLEHSPDGISDLSETLGVELSADARTLLDAHLNRYASDAEQLPHEILAPKMLAGETDPFAIAAALRLSPGLVMRRMAILSGSVLDDDFGLALCDGTGTLTYRKPLQDFSLPRFGAGCPLWPLYSALCAPGMPIMRLIAQPGATDRQIKAFAYAEDTQAPALDGARLLKVHMLMVPVPFGAADEKTEAVGVSCRICPRNDCAGRREPSILSTGQ